MSDVLMTILHTPGREATPETRAARLEVIRQAWLDPSGEGFAIIGEEVASQCRWALALEGAAQASQPDDVPTRWVKSDIDAPELDREDLLDELCNRFDRALREYASPKSPLLVNTLKCHPWQRPGDARGWTLSFDVLNYDFGVAETTGPTVVEVAPAGAK